MPIWIFDLFGTLMNGDTLLAAHLGTIPWVYVENHFFNSMHYMILLLL